MRGNPASNAMAHALKLDSVVHIEDSKLRRTPRVVVGRASVRTAAISTGVALTLVALGAAAPMQLEPPLLQAAVAAPLALVDGWEGVAGWRGPLRESGLIAFVGFALLAAGAFVRKTL